MLLRLFETTAGDETSSTGRVGTGHNEVSCSQHLRPIGLPLNPMECGFFFMCSLSPLLSRPRGRGERCRSNRAAGATAISADSVTLRGAMAALSEPRPALQAADPSRALGAQRMGGLVDLIDAPG